MSRSSGVTAAGRGAGLRTSYSNQVTRIVVGVICVVFIVDLVVQSISDSSNAGGYIPVAVVLAIILFFVERAGVYVSGDGIVIRGLLTKRLNWSDIGEFTTRTFSVGGPQGRVMHKRLVVVENGGHAIQVWGVSGGVSKVADEAAGQLQQRLHASGSVPRSAPDEELLELERQAHRGP